MERLILIKYGELTTKKDNRKLFINVLEKNIVKLLGEIDFKIIKDRVRMFIMSDDKNVDIIINKLARIFGIHSIAMCYKVNNNIDDINDVVVNIIQDKKQKSFKIETKRSNKKFAIPSMEVSRIIGAYVLKKTDYIVDVHCPDLLVKVEIRENDTYVYIDEVKGSGGYPVGVQGSGLLMLSGGIDSPVAGYLALKRGINVECLYFESPPHTSVEAKNKVLKLAQILNNYSGNIKVHVVPFTKIQETIYKEVPSTYMITILRRMMYRIASIYANEKKFKVIINGESIGQVASQTLSSMVVINDVTTTPIIRPVACMDKLEIIDLAKKIDTYETSILPFEDCCTIFVPRHPVINPVLEVAQTYEKVFNYEELIREAINNIEVVNLNKKNNYDELL